MKGKSFSSYIKVCGSSQLLINFNFSLEGEQWICKPTGANQGKGIFLIKSLDQVRDKLTWDEAHCRATCRPTSRIIQR